MSHATTTMELKLKAGLALLCFAYLVFSSYAIAESADRDKPIDLEADSLNVDDAKQISTYLGNVILTKGTIVIHADKLIVRDNTAGFQSTSLGNPTTFKQKLDGKNEYMQGSAQRIEYDDRLNKVQLYTKAWVKRGDDIVHGDYISYDANSEYAEVIGGTKSTDGVISRGRVHAVIQPKNKNVTEPMIDHSKPNNPPNTSPNNTTPIKDSRFSRSLGIGVDQKQ